MIDLVRDVNKFGYARFVIVSPKLKAIRGVRWKITDDSQSTYLDSDIKTICEALTVPAGLDSYTGWRDECTKRK
jgi:hypothetical protein